MKMPCRYGAALALTMVVALAARAAEPPSQAARALPPAVGKALERAALPPDAVTLWVGGLDPLEPPRLQWRAQEPVNPASVMKLVTTFAGLDMLGPAYMWQTRVYADAAVQADGVLPGNIYIQGGGDPSLVMENLWLLMRRLRGQGIREIAGDLVLDNSAFRLPPHDAAAFDGEPDRPYNAAPDALLLNYRSVVLTFTPNAATGQAMVQVDPPMAALEAPAHVPLAAAGTSCGDWRAALKADLGQAQRIQLHGRYPAACGVRTWPVALAAPESFAARAALGMWREVGGTLRGQVRTGTVPQTLAPVLTHDSPPLAQVIRYINKYSNNVMAQQLFLTLSLERKGQGTPEGSREALQQWWRQRLGSTPAPVVDNGAGLSRNARISAAALARMLQAAWASPVMPEYVSSLPVAGVDGTLRRLGDSSAKGVAHLKTGSLRDVNGVAGYVLAPDGKRYVVVAIANHANADAMPQVVEALLAWTLKGE